MCSPAWAEEEPRPQLQVLEGPGVACTLPSCAGAFPGACPPGARWALGVSGSPLHTQEQTSPMTPPFKGKATAVHSFQGAQKGPVSPTPRPHPTGSPNTTAARRGLSAPAPDDVSTLQSTEGSPWPSRTAGGIPGLSPSRPPLLCRMMSQGPAWPPGPCACRRSSLCLQHALPCVCSSFSSANNVALLL